MLGTGKEFYLETGDGHSLYCSVYGRPVVSALLLIHGGAGYTFDTDRIDFTGGRDAVVMHQRGVGLSRPFGLTANNTIDKNIEDIELLRTTLNLKQWDLFSWSMGTVLMSGYAFRHPGRCASLTAYAPYLGSDEDYAVIGQSKPEQGARYYAFHGSDKGRDIVSSVFEKASNPGFAERFKAYHNAINALSEEPLGAEALLAQKTIEEWTKTLSAYEIGAKLDHELFHARDRFLEKEALPLSCPVTFLYGTEDVWTGPTAYARRVFPGHKSIFVPNAGHDVHDKRVQDALKPVLTGDGMNGHSRPTPG